MNIFDKCDSLLIIGNGFDKSCGLKSSFKDVYNEYFQSPSNSEIIRKFKSDIASDKENWSDFELAMSYYASTFDSEDGFIECLEDFNMFMHNYLIKQQKQFHDSLTDNKKYIIQEFKRSINNLGFGVNHNIDNLLTNNRVPSISNMGFISLNYTDILDVLLKYSFSNIFYHTPIHVHGVLGDDPILGMDREDQVDVKYIVSDRFKRHFFKPYLNSLYDSSRVENAISLINDVNYIYVFGASLGESDLSWREFLMDWLKNNKEHHLFIYWHTNSKFSLLSPANRMDYEIEDRKKLLLDWNLKSDDFPIDQVHFPYCMKLFQIEDAKTVNT